MTLCLLCEHRELDPWNGSQVCQECRLIVGGLLAVELPERWATIDVAGTNGVLVSDHGRVARLLVIDTSSRYPRVSILSRKHYVHALVAAGFHGPRPPGALVLHGDDDPTNPSAANLRYGDAIANARDRERNRRRRAVEQKLAELDQAEGSTS
jgi:hypothetical protein